jgi:hypothetical protein
MSTATKSLGTQKSVGAQQTVDPQSIYVISDQRADVVQLYSRLGIEMGEEEGTCLRFEIFTFAENGTHFELYVFPRSRWVRPYCGLYSLVAPNPSLIVYAVDAETTMAESIEWLSLFQSLHSVRVAFFSSANTYLERQCVLSKVNALFLRSATDHVFFPNMNPSAFEDCFYNVGSVGVPLQLCVRLTPAFSQLRHLWRRLTAKSAANSSDVSAI